MRGLHQQGSWVEASRGGMTLLLMLFAEDSLVSISLLSEQGFHLLGATGTLTIHCFPLTLSGRKALFSTSSVIRTWLSDSSD